MERPATNNKRLETAIYAGLWLTAIVLILLDIMRSRSYTNTPLLDAKTIGNLLLTLLPFMTLFALNNYLLIPKLLKRGHYTRYFLSVLLSVALIWLWQKFQFFNFFDFGQFEDHQLPPHPGPHPLLPLPLFLDVIYDLLIIGMNLAISLLFQHFADRLQHESLLKENVENRLSYLKAQINPHFYMNMLNNIHGMIEIDPSRAQEMVIEMSRLMRYMLYESSRPEIGLAAEVRFIRDYLALMRVRYPESSVKIETSLPEGYMTAGISIPPLLFLVFIENAFKHGISYERESFVSVDLSVDAGSISFRCINSQHSDKTANHKKGIGLENVKRRLDILFENHYTLEITSDDCNYAVTLILPYNEINDTDC